MTITKFNENLIGFKKTYAKEEWQEETIKEIENEGNTFICITKEVEDGWDGKTTVYKAWFFKTGK